MAIQRRKQINIGLLIPFFTIALVFGVIIWQKYWDSREVPSEPYMQHSTGKRTAVLFFVADGASLAREARELDPCDNTITCVKDVLEELASGPLGEFDEALPEGTVFNRVSINGVLAIIDLNRTFIDTMPSGSSAEMLAVYSIVDTITANFPQITSVKLTIEGDEKVVLNHLDLTDPLVPDYTLEQPLGKNSDAESVSPPLNEHRGKP